MTEKSIHKPPPSTNHCNYFLSNSIVFLYMKFCVLFYFPLALSAQSHIPVLSYLLYFPYTGKAKESRVYHGIKSSAQTFCLA